MKKLAIATAVSSVLGVSSGVSADTIDFSFTALNTWASLSGAPIVNTNSTHSGGFRTPVSGTGTFDTVTGMGSATVSPFSFLGGGFKTFSGISLQAIGNGGGVHPSPTLIAGEMSYDWNSNLGIPVTMVYDAAGFFANLPAPGNTVTIGSGCAGCAVSATADGVVTVPSVGTFTFAIGAVPIAMTNYNTAGTTLGSLFPLVDDGIAGSPETTAPFPGFNNLFDFTSITATNTSLVPVPAAVWLFGSGLAGLIGIARRRRS